MNKTAFCKTVCRCLCFMSLLLCGTLLMSARPQDEGFISITMRDVPLNEVMDEITGQSGYLFINRGVDTGRTVSINVSDATIKEVCEALFTPVGISYDIQMSNIIITNAREPEPVNISGTVLGEDGFPVPGAAVIESGTSNGTTADLDGKFSLTVSDASASVTFSSLGYDSVTLPVGTRTIFNVPLREEAVALEGTVVTALGIRRDEKALSYNVQEVSSEMLTEVKNANFINSLAGKVAGVTVNTSSSGVGGASKVVLRGNKSISQSSNALYVIDGIPMYNFGGGGGTEFDSKGATESIADLNPEDISSISVLTGAAAAALYGSEAANGAIMITTKAGEAGKLKVSFSSNTEFLSPFVLPEFQSVRDGTEREQQFRRDFQLGRIHSGEREVQLHPERLLRDRSHLHKFVFGQRRHGQEPDLFFRRGGELGRHHPQQQVRPLQLHFPQHHLFPERQAEVRRLGKLYHPEGPEHDEPGCVLQSSGAGLPFPEGEQLRHLPQLRAVQ